MKIHEIMSVPVRTSTPDAWLAHAARLMRDADYGILPVTDSDGCVVGILTDRDICLAVADNNRSPLAIRVHEVMTKTVTFVRPADDVRVALSAMQHARVRRVPVIDDARHLVGVVSLDDLAIKGIDAGAVTAADIVTVLRSLCERRLSRRMAA